MASCNVCFRKCEIREGSTGFCGVRSCRDGKVVCDNYGRVTSLALDPIEKKPLRRYYPGSAVLSVGSFGCNLRCPFCQNHDISWSQESFVYGKKAEKFSPEDILRAALSCADRGNIGVAYTYNEPLVGYEFVRDCAKLIRDAGMKNVMVTNGTASVDVLEELLPYIDAMNIDLKGFSEEYYRKTLGGSLEMVKEFIERAAWGCHVELTTLIVPGENDSLEEMERMSSWIAGLDSEIPYHISRFFPGFHMTDRQATDVRLVYELAEVAKKKLKYVYTGNC